MKGLSVMEKKIIEDKANEILEKYPATGNIVDVVEIGKNEGFKILNAIIPDSEDGFIIINPNSMDVLGVKNDKFIAVNSTRSIENKRFILAHELGHFFLHYNPNDGIFAHRENKKGKGEMEQDVDYFAACLLMPKSAFVNRYNEIKKKGCTTDEIISILKDEFMVSKESVSRRFIELALE